MIVKNSGRKIYFTLQISAGKPFNNGFSIYEVSNHAPKKYEMGLCCNEENQLTVSSRITATRVLTSLSVL